MAAYLQKKKKIPEIIFFFRRGGRGAGEGVGGWFNIKEEDNFMFNAENAMK